MTSYGQNPFGGPKAPPFQPQQPGANPGAAPNANPAGRKSGRPFGNGFFNWIRTLGFNRSSERWLGGVSGAIANRLGWDPIIIRIIWFAFFCAAGFGALFYGLAWLLLPDERDGVILAEDALVGGRFPSSFWIAIVMMIIGCPGSLFAVPFISIPVFVVLIIVAAVLYNRDASRRGATGAGPGRRPAGNGPAPAYGNAAPTNGPQQPYAAPQPPNMQFHQAPPPRRVPPVVYRRKPAGPVVVGITSGLLLLSLAALLYFLYFAGFPDMPSPVMLICLWVLGATFVLGIVTIVVGFAGRKSGGLIPITIIALICSICAYAAMPAYTTVANKLSGEYGESAIRANVNYRSDDFYQLRGNGLQAVSSNVTVDLSDWRTVHPDEGECPTGDFPIDAMSSTVTIILPSGCNATPNMNLMFASASSYSGSESDDSLFLVGDAAFSSIHVTDSSPTTYDRYDDPETY